MTDQEAFKARITALHGSDGRAWLAQLPSLINSIQMDWQIQVGEPLPALTYHFVAMAICADGSEAVLKLGVPGQELAREAECLLRYAGCGAVRLFRHDSHQGALLLERIRPGQDLKQLGQTQAVDAAVGVMRSLHQAPVPDRGMPTVEQWGEGFRRYRMQFPGSRGPLPADTVEEAEGLFFELVGSMERPVLLHGDLHHENILSAERAAWLAIDPQGVIGEPAYEVGAFLRNPMPEMLDWDGLQEILAARVSRFSRLLGIEPRRLAGWGYAQAVLSAIWTIEEQGSGWEGALHVAHALRPGAFP